VFLTLYLHYIIGDAFKSSVFQANLVTFLRNMIMHSKNLLAVLIIALFTTSSYCAECPKGTVTKLNYTLNNVPTINRLDQSIGQTRFVLTDTNGTTRLSKDYDGKWFCLAFNKATKTYIVGGVFQIGAWLPLGSIQYLREDKNSFEPSIFDRLGYIANAAVTSPNGRYIAFIGGQQTTGQLYVLDTQTDTIKSLGVAPAPPPLANEAFVSEEPFEWGTGWADSYVEMETNILRFSSENSLQVSYGKDTAHARATKRRIHTFKLGCKKCR
jgi:hypothetical protein